MVEFMGLKVTIMMRHNDIAFKLGSALKKEGAFPTILNFSSEELYVDTVTLLMNWHLR